MYFCLHRWGPHSLRPQASEPGHSSPIEKNVLNISPGAELSIQEDMLRKVTMAEEEKEREKHHYY